MLTSDVFAVEHHNPLGFDALQPYFGVAAKVAELVDAQDLGSCGETRPGSSPGFRIHQTDAARS